MYLPSSDNNKLFVFLKGSLIPDGLGNIEHYRTDDEYLFFIKQSRNAPEIIWDWLVTGSRLKITPYRATEGAIPFSLEALQKETGIYGAIMNLPNGRYSLEWQRSYLPMLTNYFTKIEKLDGRHRYEIIFSTMKHFYAYMAAYPMMNKIRGHIDLLSTQ
jgi:hypothetical protein